MGKGTRRDVALENLDHQRDDAKKQRKLQLYKES